MIWRLTAPTVPITSQRVRMSHVRSQATLSEAPTTTTGQRLAGKLAEKGMSKRRLARESQVSYRTVCRIIAGDRLGNLDTWMRFAKALGCDISELIGENDGE